MGIVVMRLHRPHIGMELRLVQAIAVSLLLRLQHQRVKLIDRKLALAATLESPALEEEAAGDIHYHLAGPLDRILQNCNLLIPLGPGQGRVRNNRLTEDAGGFGQGHRRLLLQRRAVRQVQIVVAMSQFVGQRAHAVEGRLKVREDARLILAQGSAIRAIDLAGAWLGVDPVFAEGAGGEVREPLRIAAELLNDKFAGLLKLPGLRLLAYGCEDIIPGQLLQAERAGLRAQVAAAVSIASSVSRSILDSKSEASRGESQPRRRESVLTSPLMPFIAAARGTAAFFQAASSAS